MFTTADPIRVEIVAESIDRKTGEWSEPAVHRSQAISMIEDMVLFTQKLSARADYRNVSFRVVYKAECAVDTEEEVRSLLRSRASLYCGK